MVILPAVVFRPLVPLSLCVLHLCFLDLSHRAHLTHLSLECCVTDIEFAKKIEQSQIPLASLPFLDLQGLELLFFDLLRMLLVPSLSPLLQMLLALFANTTESYEKLIQETVSIILQWFDGTSVLF